MLDPSEVRKRVDFQAEDSPREITLSPKTVLHVDVTDGRGKRFVGDFRYKVPTIGDQVRIGQLKAVYLPNGASADPNAAMLVEQMCYLEACLEEPRPQWWQPTTFFDNAPIAALYKEALDYERRFLAGDKVDPGDQAVSREPEQSAGAGDATVGGEVSVASKRRKVLIDNSQGGG